MAMEFPSEIDNGHGEVLRFEGIERDQDGEYVRITATVQPGSGPPMHTHFHQAECLQVKSGQIEYQIEGQEPKVIGPGESVVFEAGQPHRFRAAGDAPVECEGWVRPPDNNAYFLSQIYESARRNQAGGRPNDFDVAFLLGRYGGEYDINDIPAPVKRLVFPMLRWIGRLSGKYARFADAPPPVHPR